MSDRQARTSIRWFGAWNEQCEMQWLGDMSHRGWHLTAVAGPVYRFVAGEPADYRYDSDWNTLSSPRRDEYLQLFADAGWEFVARSAGWHYFRAPAAAGDVPAIYTDSVTHAQKYRRVMAFAAVAMFPVALTVVRDLTIPAPRAYLAWSLPLRAAATLLGIYGLVRMAIIVKRLSRRPSE